MDYESYLNSVIDSTYVEVKPLVGKIRAIGACPCCGGSFVNDTCKYCCTENKDLNTIIPLLERILARFADKINNLPISAMPINKLFNLLHSLYGIEISCINVLLDKYGYKEIFSESLDVILSVLTPDLELTDIGIDFLEAQMYRNDPKINLSSVYDYFIRNALSRRKNISYEAFSEMIKRFTEMLMRTYYPNPSCHIAPKRDLIETAGESSIGYCNNDQIWIAKECVDSLYFGGSNEVISVIFHELTHVAQNKLVFYGNKLSLFILDEIKDRILKTLDSTYYDENYSNISYELEALFCEISRTMEYLEKLGFSVDRKTHQQHLDAISSVIGDKKRVINGEEVNLDVEFEKAIYNHPEFLKRYKQLCYIFKEEDGVVIPKSPEELLEDYKIIMDNPDYDEESKEELKNFYRSYIGCGRRD